MSEEKLVPKLRFSGFDNSYYETSWCRYSVKNACDVLTGFPFKSEQYVEEGNYKVVRGDNVKSGFIKWDEKTRCWNDLDDKLEKYLLKENDIIIGMDGSKVGRNQAIIIKNDLPSLLAQRVACIRTNDNFNQDYLKQIFFNDKFTRYVDAVKTGTSIYHISKKQIENFKFTAPSLEEQEKIAKFLSNIDIKIELLEKKHEYYLDFKKYLMQQIFTQKLRFADINEYTLKQISEKIENGFSGTQVNYETPFPVTRIETISSGKINYDKVGFVNEIPERYLLKEGDILLTNINSMKWIGNSVYYDGDRILYHGMNLMLLRSKTEINSKYLYYYITYNNNWFKKMACQAVNQASINKSTLEKFIVKIPDVETQNNIANVLTFADEKINGISDQIELSMKFKKGLLQQMFV